MEYNTNSGRREKISIPVKDVIPKSPRRLSAPVKSVPLPKNSRIVAIQNTAAVKPIPIPRPSAAEAITLFLPAKASALPKRIQLTTISGRKTPSASSSAGINALIRSCTIVTNDAITTIYAGILTLEGITLRRSEITMLEQSKTIVTEMPIPMALTIDVLVASVGHVPRTSLNTGFSAIRPLVNSCLSVFFSAIYRTSFCNFAIK